MTNEAYSTKYHFGLNEPQLKPMSLSLLVGQNTFAFAIFIENYSRCIELAHVNINSNSTKTDILDNISFLINNYLLHQKKFDKVQLSLLSTNFTMVPEAFGADQKLSSLLKFTTGDINTNTTRHHNLSGLAFSYGIDQPLLAYFENTFPNIYIRHAGATTINLLLNHHSLQYTNVFLNVHDTSIELGVKENTKLIFYNNFSFENNEDILYYLLFTMEQFELNPLHIKLSIAGQVDVSSELAKSIRRYVKQVTFCTYDNSLNLIGELASLPHHYYFTLLNQHLCEL